MNTKEDATVVLESDVISEASTPSRLPISVPATLTTSAPVAAADATTPATLHADARAKVASGDLKAAFHAYRQLLAGVTTFTDAEVATISGEMAPLVPRWLEHATPFDAAAFRHALSLHRPLAQALSIALEHHAAREAALLTFAISSLHTVNNRHSETLAMLRGVPTPEIVSPNFEASFKELKHTATVGSQAQLVNGWAANLVTPYPLMPDGKPKLTAAWLEITSFCNQKCTFCPDPFREGKRQAMDVETAKRCIDELKNDFHLDYLMLNAFGEPLLHPKIEEILTYLRDGHSPCHFFFTTHGMTLNERNIAMIDRAHPNGILISLQNDSEESYALTRDLRIGNYTKLVGNIMNLITRLVQNRRACHVRLYQLVRNGHEGFGVPEKILRAFPSDWTRFAQAVRRWEDALRPLADGHTVHAVRNSDDEIREAFSAGGWPKLDVLRWRDEKGGEQSVFISPRAPETYANQLPHLAPDWSVKRSVYSKASCRFTRDPGLAIMSNGNLGICCLSLEQNASFGNLRDFSSLKDAVTSEACQRMFAELANGITRSHDCQICLGSIEKNGSGCSGHCG